MAEIQDDLSPELQASGFDTHHAKTLEQFAAEVPNDSDSNSDSDSDELSERSLQRNGATEHFFNNEANAASSEIHTETSHHPGIDSARLNESSANESREEDQHRAQLHNAANAKTKGNEDSNLHDSDDMVENEDPVDLETAVRDQLLLESRKAKQVQKIRNAVRSAHKTGDKRTRSRGGVNLEY